MRVLLKLSGEALAGDKGSGFDQAVVQDVARQIRVLHDRGFEVGVVTGGGNFWRGRSGDLSIDRTVSDEIGMLATMMNCLYVSEALRASGLRTAVLTPFVCGTYTEQFSKDRAVSYLLDGRVVLFAGGTGHPFFTTDTGAVLRAAEIDADYLLLAKSIDAVYDSDPAKNPDARRYETVSIDEVIARSLQVVDLTASVMARDHKLPMRVFRLADADSIIKAADGERVGTYVTVD